MKRLSFLLLLIVAACGQPSKTTPKLEFEQVGYYKGENNLRYLTFYVQSNMAINKDSIPESVLEQIKTHGVTRMHTEGQVTASFYYLSKSQTPDITMLTAQEANDLAHQRKPIASVWIFPTGNVEMIVKPE